MNINDYVSMVLSHYHRKVRRKESRTVGDMQMVSNIVLFIGQLPLLIPIVSRLGFKEIVDHFCPMEREHTENLTHGEVFEALIFNRLTSPCPLYRVEEWAMGHNIEALFGIDPLRLNDDRIARTLEVVAEKVDEIQGSLSLKMMKEYSISADAVHYDITSLSFEGYYNKSEIIKFGYNRDKRPDLKQVNLSLDVTRDSAIPVWSQVLEGNKSDVKTVVENMKKLQQHVKTKDYVTIMDRGMVSGDNLHSLMDNSVGFIVSVPLRGKSMDLILSTADDDFSSIEYTNRSGDDNIRAARCFPEFKTKKIKKGDHNIVFKVSGYIFESSLKIRRDQLSREKGIKKIAEIFGDISGKLNTGKYKKRDYVVKQIEKRTGRKKAGKLFWWELSGEDGELELEYCLDEDAMKKSEALDGKYILATDSESRSADDVIEAYKCQYQVERRFHNLKSNLKVTPIFLKKDIRIMGLVFATIVSLMVYSLLEHLCRKAELGLTAFMLFERFGVCGFSRMRFSNGQILYAACDPTAFQKMVLDSLGFPYPREYI